MIGRVRRRRRAAHRRSCCGSAHVDHPILDVSFFANPRFTAASVAITLVFFAMFGSLFFVSQYLQFVLGYCALESGVRLLPVAGALMVAAPLSAVLVGRFGTKRIVTLGLVLVALALLVFSRITITSGYPLVALVLVDHRRRHGAGDGAGHRLDHGLAAAGEGRHRLGHERHHPRDRRRPRCRDHGQHHGRRLLVARSPATPVLDAADRRRPRPRRVKESIGAASIVAAELPAELGRLDHRGGQRRRSSTRSTGR